MTEMKTISDSMAKTRDIALDARSYQSSPYGGERVLTEEKNLKTPDINLNHSSSRVKEPNLPSQDGADFSDEAMETMNEKSSAT